MRGGPRFGGLQRLPSGAREVWGRFGQDKLCDVAGPELKRVDGLQPAAEPAPSDDASRIWPPPERRRASLRSVGIDSRGASPSFRREGRVAGAVRRYRQAVSGGSGREGEGEKGGGSGRPDHEGGAKMENFLSLALSSIRAITLMADIEPTTLVPSSTTGRQATPYSYIL